jgi:hypothetical protein
MNVASIRSTLRVGVAGLLASAAVFAAVVAVNLGATATSSATCAISGATTGSLLTISGTGYRAGTNYTIDITWPNNAGTGAVAVRADASGSWVTTAYAYWTGTYAASVYKPPHEAALATCSMMLS